MLDCTARPVGFVDAVDILAGALNDEIALLVMPGGADLYYCEKLAGDGDARIRRWVEDGGRYLGICAGGYYGASSLVWAQGSDQEIAGPRALSFIDCVASGPVSDFIQDGALAKSHLASVPLRWDDGVEMIDTHVCYQGGPVFGESDATVLARYVSLPGQPPAVVERRVGQGAAILCSAHIERAGDDQRRALYRHRNPSYRWDNQVSDRLEQAGPDNRRLRRKLFDRAVGDRP